MRADVQLPKDTLLPNPHDAVQRAIVLDFASMSATKEETIKKFTEILRPGK